MIRFTYNKRKLSARMTLNDNHLNLILDTGAESTVLCARDVLTLLGGAESADITPRQHHVKEFIGVTHNKVEAHAAILRNVKIGDYLIPKFPCFVRTDDVVGVNLLGMDIIHQCSGMLFRHGDFLLKDIPSSSDLLKGFLEHNKLTKINSAYVLFGIPMSHRELAAAVMEDSSLSPSVEEFRSAFKMDDKDFAELLYTVIKDFDVHTLSKFEDVQKDYHVLEKAYRAKGTVHVF